MMKVEKSPVLGFFPYGQTRTRRPPGIEHLQVGTSGRAQPFEEIQYQTVEIVIHSVMAIHLKQICPGNTQGFGPSQC